MLRTFQTQTTSQLTDYLPYISSLNPSDYSDKFTCYFYNENYDTGIGLEVKQKCLHLSNDLEDSQKSK